MTTENFTETVAGHGAALPVLALKQLDADPHGVFRQYRKDHAVVLHETGGYFVLRLADVDRLGKDPRVGSSGTSFPEAMGIGSGAIFDLFEYSMITADGDVHRRRRAPLSRQFAARTINEMRQSIRRTADDRINGRRGRDLSWLIGFFSVFGHEASCFGPSTARSIAEAPRAVSSFLAIIPPNLRSKIRSVVRSNVEH